MILQPPSGSAIMIAIAATVPVAPLRFAGLSCFAADED
jgi:hypothetical protein